MSEEILKALMQLFAIISKQDDGSTVNQRKFVETFLSTQLNDQKVQEYLSLYDSKVDDESHAKKEPEKSVGRLTTVKDSVKTLAICRKINKTLTHGQKVIVLIRLYEMLMTEQSFTGQRIGIISTVSEVFNIKTEELNLINGFIRNIRPDQVNLREILIIRNNTSDIEGLDGDMYVKDHILFDNSMVFMRIKSADLYFVKYNGSSEIFLNGQLFNTNKIYLFPNGSTIRMPKGTVYYNDVVSRFLRTESKNMLSFKANNLVYRFPNGVIGLKKINISEEFGLIGIMGASGSGKTTLLNVLSGIEKPCEGSVVLNGLDIHRNIDETKSMIGYISQDDLLIEDLTVFENLYYNSKLCFSNLDDGGITELVNKTLSTLGLLDIKDIKVGGPLNKKISGGQRKRLNIALEIIREPSVLFVDEPTSGLSSRDSENVMDLLKEISLQMKLVFVVIHQPSSDIFKMFDSLLLLDRGGYPIYYGNPIESVMYFKKEAQQVNSEVGECYACGNVNPELLFNIIESREVDEFGQFTEHRIKEPDEWNRLFLNNFRIKNVEETKALPPKTFKIPGKFKQTGLFIKRDVLSKISNLQYVLISLLEAPIMAVFLTMIIKYIPDNRNHYVFSENENIPPYIFMSIIIALFIGLSVSAEEIFKDRKILKRERFLNLSRLSYILSKIVILFTLSAIQMVIFVFVGNTILEIKGLSFEYWIVLFSVSCFANMLGLNISSAFDSAVTIYILIPLLVIPQMALGGAMFNFDKISKSFGGNKNTTPVLSDIMASRWSYEALAVTQFRSNRYEQNFFEIEQIESEAYYFQSFYIPELQKIINRSVSAVNAVGKRVDAGFNNDLDLLRNEFITLIQRNDDIQVIDIKSFDPDGFDGSAGNEALSYLAALDEKYVKVYNAANKKKNELIEFLQNEYSGNGGYVQFRESYYNEFLSDIVRKATVTDKIKREGDYLFRNFEPIFLNPSEPGLFSLRSHFFAPNKYVAGEQVSTLVFNLIVIWIMSMILFITLYYDLLGKLISGLGRMKNNG